MSGMRAWFGRGLDQDWVDTANGLWSVLLLCVCSVSAFAMCYITQPTICWTPAQFTNPQVSYANQICFLEEKIPIESMSGRGRMTRDQMESYHLWIPMILFLQALCFKIPNIIWNLGKHSLTVNMEEIVEAQEQGMETRGNLRGSTITIAATLLGRSLENNRIFLAILYLFVKLLFCLNLFGQLVFLTISFQNLLLIKAGSYLNVDMESITKPLFIRNTYCFFDITQRANVHSNTLQCTFPITEVYEKLFVFLWLWVFLLAVVTFFNLLLWAGFLFIPFFRDSRITSSIKASLGYSQDYPAITRFVSSFLGIDGVLFLSMISRNSSEMVAADLSLQLYQIFLGRTNQPVPATAGEGEICAAVSPDLTDAGATPDSPALL